MSEFREFTIDLKDYSKEETFFKRTAARGIILIDGKYLLIHGKYGDYKFPGGGMEKGEGIEQTLAREVSEETGFIVKDDSIQKAFLVHEKRKGEKEDLMLMDSYYFYCDVNSVVGKRNLDDYEKEYNYQVCFLTLEEAIQKNKSVKNIENIPWIRRDTLVMEELCKCK